MPAIDSALDAVVGPVAEILGEATTASVLAGAAEVAGGESAAPLTPSAVAGIFNPFVEPVKSTGTLAARAASAGPAAGNVFFPVIDEATAAIADAAVLSPDDYYALAAGHRAGAFTISAALVDGTKAKIRDLLVENLAAGASVKEFVAAVSEGFDTGLPLSRAHVEQVFRNNVHGGFSDGQDAALAASASAGDGLPYRAYNATTDQRVREEHIALETLGLDGTNIYRADDPVWKIFRPPWSWNCRCDWSPVSVRQAARRGVTEAAEWLARAEAMAAERGGTAGRYLDETAPGVPAWVPMPKFADDPEVLDPRWRRS